MLNFFTPIWMYKINNKHFLKTQIMFKCYKNHFFFKIGQFFPLLAVRTTFSSKSDILAIFHWIQDSDPSFWSWWHPDRYLRPQIEASNTKNDLEHVKVAKLRFAATKFGQNHAFLSIFPQFSPKIFILTPQVLYIFGKLWQWELRNHWVLSHMLHQ